MWYTLAMDESNDLTGTLQLLIFIRGVNLDFQITERLASVCSMHETTTGEDRFSKLKKLCNVTAFIGTNFSALQLMEEKT